MGYNEFQRTSPSLSGIKVLNPWEWHKTLLQRFSHAYMGALIIITSTQFQPRWINPELGKNKKGKASWPCPSINWIKIQSFYNPSCPPFSKPRWKGRGFDSTLSMRNCRRLDSKRSFIYIIPTMNSELSNGVKGGGQLKRIDDYLFIKYSWIELAAFLPAPMAKMTVADPVTISPPAQTPGLLVFPVSRSATI